MTTSEVSGVASKSLLVVPLGATEQHGPHLPLGTDTSVAVALAWELSKQRSEVVIAPTLPYGSSGEHQSFSGTLSIGQKALELLVVELARSAAEFRAVLFVSGHGGNAEPLTRAHRTLAAESRNVEVWWPKKSMLEGLSGPDSPDSHAGWVETSILMSIDPAGVRSDEVARGNMVPVDQVGEDLKLNGVSSVSSNGVLGDPTIATTALGSRIIAALVEDLMNVTNKQCEQILR